LSLSSIVLGYIGIAPGVTDLMRTNRPIDLGIRYNPSDFEKFKDKSLMDFYDFKNALIDPKNPRKNLIISPANTVLNDFSDKEITAALGTINWTGSPIKNAQTRFSKGKIEISGNIDPKYLVAVINSINTNEETEVKLSPVFRFAKYFDNPSIYIKANLSVDESTDSDSGGWLNINSVEIKINRFSLPKEISSLIAKSEPIKIKTTTSKYNYDVRKISFDEGIMHFYGTIPAAIYLGDGQTTSICSNFHGGHLISLDNSGRVGTVITYCP
jgi:hypothetical protein